MPFPNVPSQPSGPSGKIQWPDIIAIIFIICVLVSLYLFDHGIFPFGP